MLNNFKASSLQYSYNYSWNIHFLSVASYFEISLWQNLTWIVNWIIYWNYFASLAIYIQRTSESEMLNIISRAWFNVSLWLPSMASNCYFVLFLLYLRFCYVFIAIMNINFINKLKSFWCFTLIDYYWFLFTRYLINNQLINTTEWSIK